MKKHLSNLLKFTLFLGTGIVILYLVYQNQNASFIEECQQKGISTENYTLFDKIVNDFKGVNYWWVLVVLVVFTISNISRAIRWRMLIVPLGYQPKHINLFLSVILNYFANLGLPRIGEFVRAATISKYEKMAVEKVMGTIVVDRIMDVISLLIVIGITFLVQADAIYDYFNKRNQAATAGDAGQSGLLSSPILWAIVGFGLFTLILIWVFREKILASTIGQKVVSILKGFAEGLQTIRSLKRPGLFLFHSANIWVMYIMMNYLCFFAFTPTEHLGFAAGLTVFVFGALGIVIPSPGGMGSYQYLVVQALALYGISESDAFSFSNIIFFSIQIGSNVVLGIIALILLPIINQNYIPSHATNEPTEPAISI